MHCPSYRACFKEIRQGSACFLVQGTADPPCPSLVTSRTGDPYWKLVRKGVSHAFAPNNVR